MHASHNIDHQAADHHRCRAFLITGARVVHQFHIQVWMAVIATARMMTRSLFAIGTATNSPEAPAHSVVRATNCSCRCVKTSPTHTRFPAKMAGNVRPVYQCAFARVLDPAGDGSNTLMFT